MITTICFWQQHLPSIANCIAIHVGRRFRSNPGHGALTKSVLGAHRCGQGGTASASDSRSILRRCAMQCTRNCASAVQYVARTKICTPCRCRVRRRVTRSECVPNDAPAGLLHSSASCMYVTMNLRPIPSFNCTSFDIYAPSRRSIVHKSPRLGSKEQEHHNADTWYYILLYRIHLKRVHSDTNLPARAECQAWTVHEPSIFLPPVNIRRYT